MACRSVVAIEPIGQVVCGQWSGRVLTLDLSTGTRIGRQFESQHGDVCGLAVTPQGDRLATISSCVAGTATIGQWRLDGSDPASRLVTRASGDRYVEQFGFENTDALIAGWVDDSAPYPITRAIDADGTVLAELPGLFGVHTTDDPAIAVVIDNDGLRDDRTLRHGPPRAGGTEGRSRSIGRRVLDRRRCRHRRDERLHRAAQRRPTHRTTDRTIHRRHRRHIRTGRD